MKDERLVKTMMLGMVEGDWPRRRPAKDGPMTNIMVYTSVRGRPFGVRGEELMKNDRLQ